MTAPDTHRAIDAVWRIESPRLIAGLARMVRDVGLAEDLAQDALVIALERWPVEGIPANPGAWLMTIAKRRAIDQLRRRSLLERKHEELAKEMNDMQETATPDLDAAIDDDIGDDLLRLVFTSCHPVLSMESRVALTLRLLGGLTTEEIARAFLVPEPTIAQRIVRAKRTLAEKQVPFEIPRGAELAQRLSSVLEVIYLIFNEGYSATTGEDWMRPALCDDALRLGRILAELAPQESEVHGLVALMEIQASRSRARLGPSGEPVLLLNQDRARWDQLLIRRGLAALSSRREAGRRAGSLRAASGDRSVSCPRANCGSDRLGAHRVVVRLARAARALSRRGAQSRRRHRHGVWSASRPGLGRCAHFGADARELPSLAQRAWRSSGKARPQRRGTRRVRASRFDDAQ